MKTLRVFEHQTLLVGQEVTVLRGTDSEGMQIEDAYIKALWKLWDEKRNPFFSPVRNGVRFKEYVGVVRVLDLTIEILPKADQLGDNDTEDKAAWQFILIDMLRVCHRLETPTLSDATLKQRPNSILDLYIARFVIEVQGLLRRGLIKRYRTVEQNGTALKGKLLVGKQIVHNVVHAERFYTAKQQYDTDNLHNRILYKALRILPSLCYDSALLSDIMQLQLLFPELRDVAVSPQLFERLVFDRKSEPYKTAISIARLLLLHYRPDISSGNFHSIAILFNMNDLWEEYIYRILLRHKPAGVQVLAQQQTGFWRTPNGGVRQQKPDLLIVDGNRKVVIDTKWKNVYDNWSKVSMEDLRQLFAYQHYYDAPTCYLLYPGKETVLQQGSYFSKNYFKQQAPHLGGISGLLFAKAWQPTGSSFLNDKLGCEIWSLFGYDLNS